MTSMSTAAVHGRGKVATRFTTLIGRTNLSKSGRFRIHKPFGQMDTHTLPMMTTTSTDLRLTFTSTRTRPLPFDSDKRDMYLT